MTPPRTRRPKARQNGAGEPTPAEQVDAHLNGRPVNPRKRDLAVERHTATVAAAGKPAELDWFTRQLLDPTRGVS